MSCCVALVAVCVREPPSHYATLGVNKAATRADIRARYKTLALEFHPDKVHRKAWWPTRLWRVATGFDAHKRFLQITEAHEILIDNRRRAEYDATLKPRWQWPRLPRLGFVPAFLTLCAVTAFLEYLVLPFVYDHIYALLWPPPKALPRQDLDAARARARARQQADYTAASSRRPPSRRTRFDVSSRLVRHTHIEETAI